MSDDSDSEVGDLCAICLGIIKGKIGSPDATGCEHFFCLLCILEWAKVIIYINSLFLELDTYSFYPKLIV